MEEPADQSMIDLDSETHLPFSEDEEKVLALYDQLQELRLEIAIINGQKSTPRGQVYLLEMSFLLQRLTFIQMQSQTLRRNKHKRRKQSYSTHEPNMSFETT
jgi:hypothetical protein